MGGIYVFTAYMAEYNVYKNVHNMHMGILGLSKLFIAVQEDIIKNWIIG